MSSRSRLLLVSLGLLALYLAHGFNGVNLTSLAPLIAMISVSPDWIMVR